MNDNKVGYTEENISVIESVLTGLKRVDCNANPTI